MQAKAGEGDRVIKTKMVRRPFFYVLFLRSFLHVRCTDYLCVCSQNICSPASGRAGRRSGDELSVDVCICTCSCSPAFLHALCSTLFFTVVLSITFFSAPPLHSLLFVSGLLFCFGSVSLYPSLSFCYLLFRFVSAPRIVIAG